MCISCTWLSKKNLVSESMVLEKKNHVGRNTILDIAICRNYMINNYACLTCPPLPRSQFFLYSFKLLKMLAHPEIPFSLHSLLSLALLSVCNGWQTPPLFYCTIQTHSQNLLLYPASLNCLEKFKSGCFKVPLRATLEHSANRFFCFED